MKTSEGGRPVTEYYKHEENYLLQNKAHLWKVGVLLAAGFLLPWYILLLPTITVAAVAGYMWNTLADIDSIGEWKFFEGESLRTIREAYDQQGQKITSFLLRWGVVLGLLWAAYFVGNSHPSWLFNTIVAHMS